MENNPSEQNELPGINNILIGNQIETPKPKILEASCQIQHVINTRKSFKTVCMTIEYLDENHIKYEWYVVQTFTKFKEVLKFIKNTLFENEESETSIKVLNTLPHNFKETFKLFKGYSFRKLREIGNLKDFLNTITHSDLFNFIPIKEFFEISSHSFATSNNSLKPKEGEIIKRAEYSICQSTFIDMCHCVKCCCYTGYVKYWFMLKPDMICYLDSSNSNIGKGTFWFDNNTKLEKLKDSLVLRNGMKKMKLSFEEIFQRNNWYKELNWRIERFKKNYKDNPFKSFVLEKTRNKCRWFIDGEDYFSHLYNSLLNAKQTVFITDWWMSPEVFLKRPVDMNVYEKLKFLEPYKPNNPNELTRLCDILNYIAEKGVRVYIQLYCEFAMALTLDSKHTKTMLTSFNKNIKVIRHPKKAFDLLWSHHEKLVIIDQKFAYVGGLDLCWGRWDTHDHPIYEPENDENKYYFPGIDYSNARIGDFMNVSDYLKLSIDRKTKKMPWHDIHSFIEGPAVLDISRHFVERWNYSKMSENDEGITDVRTTYYENDKLKSVDTIINKKEKKKKSNFFKNIFKIKHLKDEKKEDNNINNEEIMTNINKNENENEIKDAKDIEEDNFNKVTNQSVQNENIFSNLIQQAAAEKKNNLNSNRSEENLIKKENENKNENEITLVNGKPKEGYLNLLKKGIRNKFNKMIDDADLENKNDNTQILSTYINLHSYNVDFSSEEIRMTCQCLRSLSYWSGGLNKTEQSILNGYYHLIENSKHYIYIENQFFISKSFTNEELDKKGRCVSNLIINEIALKLTDRIIKAHQNHEKFRVMIVIPLLPGFAGEVETSSTLQVILKFTYKSISRNKGLSMIEKLKELLDKNNPELFREYIGFFSLRNHAVIDNVPVTELIYIHSKLMIVDDRYVIMGSANINDRSMTGERDSEFAVIYSEDENSLKSMMNGKLYDSCAFAKSLRINIWREHLGIKDKNIIDDPLSDDVWKLITETAKKNTLVYRDLFNCYPDDTMIYFKDIPKNKNLTEEEKNILIEKYNKRKDEIVGHLVEFPYEFLKEEFLERSFFSAEMLVPIKNFV